MNVMKQTITTTHICGRCKCELPLEEFYINKKSQRPDNYCKECRKETSRTQRKNSKASNSVEETRKYPVITEIQDRESRMKLIMHALEVVRESIARKRRKRSRGEFFNTEN
jgi:hypothetical protein